MDKSQLRKVVSPKENEAQDEVLVIQFATTEIKEIIAKGVSAGWTIEEVNKAIRLVIAKAMVKVGRMSELKVKNALQTMAKRDLYTLTENLRVLNTNIARKAQDSGYQININPDGAVTPILDKVRFRGLWTDAKKGLPLIEDYQKKVREQMKLLSSQPPKVVTFQTKGGRTVTHTMSARNYAEMTARHQANKDDVDRLKEEGVDLVWISSHADASVRCEPYQGKLYSISGDNVGRVVDGNKVHDLNEAMLGPRGDGNGIINGYNCRHYLIEYTPGSRAPIDYDKTTVAKERAIDARQRLYENEIRQTKMQQRLAQASGDTELANALSRRWHLKEFAYQKFSTDNGRAYYTWRTVVGREERLTPNRESEKLIKQVKLELKIEKSIGLVNDAPSALKRLADTPDDAKIVMRQKERDDRDSSAEHILKSHANQIDDKFIKRMKDTINNPDFTMHDKNKNNRYILLNEYMSSKGKPKYMKVVLEKSKDNEFEIITTFYSKEKK